MRLNLYEGKLKPSSATMGKLYLVPDYTVTNGRKTGVPWITLHNEENNWYSWVRLGSSISGSESASGGLRFITCTNDSNTPLYVEWNEWEEIAQ